MSALCAHSPTYQGYVGKLYNIYKTNRTLKEPADNSKFSQPTIDAKT
jgi:hypothetical protein